MGFIRKLPHHLIEAFKSTLEEARYSDIVLHVVDCSNPQMDMQMHVVKETLEELEIVDKTIVTVFNKVDRFRELEAGQNSGVMQIPRDFSSDYQVRISARTGEGLEELQKVLQAIIRSRRILLEKVFPYSQAGRIQTIRKYGQLLEEEYQGGWNRGKGICAGRAIRKAVFRLNLIGNIIKCPLSEKPRRYKALQGFGKRVISTVNKTQYLG